MTSDWKRDNQSWQITRDLLRKRGLTNQQLATALGVSLSAANGALAGKRTHMSTTEMAAICRLLGVEPSTIEPLLSETESEELRHLRRLRDGITRIGILPF